MWDRVNIAKQLEASLKREPVQYLKWLNNSLLEEFVTGWWKNKEWHNNLVCLVGTSSYYLFFHCIIKFPFYLKKINTTKSEYRFYTLHSFYMIKRVDTNRLMYYYFILFYKYFRLTSRCPVYLRSHQYQITGIVLH